MPVNLEFLVERLLSIGMPPALREAEASFLLHLLRLLAANAEPIGMKVLTDLAVEFEISNHQLESFLRRVAERDEEGSIVGVVGLSLLEHPHKMIMGNKHFYAWCAWDTLFLPILINQNAIVRSSDPITGVEISIEVSPTAVISSTPTDAALSIVIPDPEVGCKGAAEEIYGGFCCKVHFFSSSENAGAWTKNLSVSTTVLTVPEGFELGRQVWSKFLYTQANTREQQQ